MQYHQLDGWNLSRVGLGCYGLSGAYGPVDEAVFIETIRAAYEQGVNFFDTAEGYGTAEAILGKALAPMRNEVYLATKLSGASGAPDLSAVVVRKACLASLERLGTDVIDLYQVHFDDPHTPVLETVSALDDLVAEGLIGRYGVSHLPVERVREYAQTGKLFSIMMELSPVARRAAQTLLPICAEHNLAAIAFSITGRGILSGHYAEGHAFAEGDIRRMDALFQRDCYASAMRIREFLARLGECYAATAVQMGIAWVLAQPQVACALTGTSSPAHLAENLAAAEIKLDADDLAALNRFFADEDIHLAALQKETIHDILNDPLPEEPQQAFSDLVYVMETAVTLGAVHEDAVMAAFMELFALHKALDDQAQRKMTGIQQALRKILVGHS
jgi:aryl-alcohol dehydrogenase-like predicted oxidoreductase